MIPCFWGGFPGEIALTFGWMIAIINPVGETETNKNHPLNQTKLFFGG